MILSGESLLLLVSEALLRGLSGGTCEDLGSPRVWHAEGGMEGRFLVNGREEEGFSHSQRAQL